MAIGVEFVLRASTASFKTALAGADNSIKDLKKSLRSFDVGNGLKNALGVGGVIAGFRMAITHAQELRDEADKLGKDIDRGTRSVAELGDAIGKIGTGFKSGLTAGLSFFTQIGDAARHFFQGVTQDQEDAARKMVETTGKAADEAEKRLAKSREENSPEKKAEATRALMKAEREASAQGTEDEKKLINLINERADLEKQLRETPVNTTAYIKVKEAIVQNERATKEANASIAKDEKEKADKAVERAIQNMDEVNAAERERDERAAAEKAERDANLREKYAPSVEQLANMEVGGFTAQDDPRLIARRVKEKERFAAEAGSRGDIRGAMRLGSEAEALRKSLSGTAGGGTALTAETAEVALRNALEQTNKELTEVKEALAGIIKAQP